MAKLYVNKSTNVRFVYRLLQLGFRLADTSSPELAGRLATRLFTSPLRRDPRPEQALVFSRAQHSSIAWRGDQLPVWSWGSGPTVLLIHGWSGRAAQLAGLVDPLVAAGHRVLAFDAPGHGSSPRRRITLPDFADAVSTIAAGEPLHGIIAHSFGAAAATIALGGGVTADRLVYLAPLVRLEGALDRFAAMLGLSPAGRQAFERRLVARAGIELAPIQPLRFASRLSIPLLSIHDAGDREVPASDSVALTTAWSGARLVTTRGRGHTRMLSSREVIEMATSFMLDGPLPAAPPDLGELIDRDLRDREARRRHIFGGVAEARLPV